MSSTRAKKPLVKLLPIKNIPVVSLKTLILMMKEIPQCASCNKRGLNYICQKCVMLLKSIIIKNKDQSECTFQNESIKKEKVRKINKKRDSIEKKQDLNEDSKNISLESNFQPDISLPVIPYSGFYDSFFSAN